MDTKPGLSEKFIVKRALAIWDVEIFISNFALQISGVYVSGFVMSAYLLEILKASPAFIGFIVALTMLPNALYPFTAMILQRLKRKKVFTLVFLLVGRMLFLLSLVLGYLANRNGVNPQSKYMVAGLCFIATMFSSFTPALNSWLSDLLPDKQRSQRLAMRNIIINIGAVCGVFVASFVLKQFGARTAFPIFFISTFVLFIAGFITLMNVHEPEPKSSIKNDRREIFRDAITDKNFLSFLVVVTISTLAVNLVTPFFTIFYLEYYGAPYDMVGYMTAGTTFMIVLGVFFWGRFMNVVGARLLTKVTLIFLAIIPMTWFLVPKNNYMPFMFAIAFSYSFVQGGWNIAITSSGFSIAEKSKALVYISIYSGVAALCQFTAPLLGGTLAEMYGIYKPLSNLAVLPNSIMVLFIFSTLLLLICLSVFPVYKIQREKSDLHIRHLLFRLDFALVFSRLANAAFMPYYLGDRKKLAENIGETKNPSALQPLLILMNDLDQDVRLSAIYSIGKIPGRQSRDALLNFYEESNLIEKHSIIKALGNFQDIQTENMLMDIYVSRHPLMRAEAAYSLAKRKSERAREIAIWKISTERYNEDDFLSHLAVLAANRAVEVLPSIPQHYNDMKSNRHKEYTLYYMAVIIGAKDDYYQTRSQEGEHHIKKYITKMVEALKDSKETKKNKSLLKDLSSMQKRLNMAAEREEDISFTEYQDIIMQALEKKINKDVTEIIKFFLQKDILSVAEIEFVALSILAILVGEKHLLNPKSVLKKVQDKLLETKELDD